MLIDKYRPTDFNDLYGLENVKSYFLGFDLESKWGELCHKFLFSGPNGTGKTSVARILAQRLDIDIVEINAGSETGVDRARELIEMFDKPKLNGIRNLFLIDEAHMLTSSAQNALLKPVEDGLVLDYLILVTTDRSKILRGLKQRCVELEFDGLGKKTITDLVSTICKAENREISSEVCTEIADNCYGSAREALQKLELYLETGKVPLSGGDIVHPDVAKLYKALWDKTISAADCILISDGLSPETVRISLLFMFNGTLKKMGYPHIANCMLRLTETSWIGPDRIPQMNAHIVWLKHNIYKTTL